MKLFSELCRSVMYLAMTVVFVMIAFYIPKVVFKTNIGLDDLHHTLLESSLAAENVRKASLTWNKASEQQARYFILTEKESTKSFKAIGKLASDTDSSINGDKGLIATARIAVASRSEDLGKISQQLGNTLYKVSLDEGQVSLNTNQLLIQTTNRITNSNIDDTLKHINTATKELSGVATDAHTETTLLVGKTRDAFQPESRAKSILKLLFNGTLNGSELYYYLNH